jgi:hypothetical protein
MNNFSSCGSFKALQFVGLSGKWRSVKERHVRLIQKHFQAVVSGCWERIRGARIFDCWERARGGKKPVRDIWVLYGGACGALELAECWTLRSRELTEDPWQYTQMPDPIFADSGLFCPDQNAKIWGHFVRTGMRPQIFCPSFSRRPKKGLQIDVKCVAVYD